MCITVITFINLFHVCITFINHVYLTFQNVLFTSEAQQEEDNYPMFYWTINSYHVVLYHLILYLIISEYIKLLCFSADRNE